MGCASSKQKRCIHCNNTPNSPGMPRSYSMHVHHPPQSKGDSYHVVALTSTTLGSLDQLSNKISSAGNGFRFNNGKVSDSDSDRFVLVNDDNSRKDIIDAKNWSSMIDQKLPKTMPKTPITTPPCELETINTWELMEGLEDSSPLRSSPNHFKSFSFNGNLSNGHVDSPHKTMKHEEEEPNLIKKASISESEDPQVVPSFKKISDVVVDFEPTPFGKKEEKVVFYFTSLRGVRKTYEDCCHVRLILKGLGVKLDERDVSMHSGFKEELKELLAGDNNGFSGKKGGLLPRVFVGRNYIGGAEEIQRLHEDGKLEKLLQSCEKIDASDCGGGGGEEVCEACGDVRFVPCETCFGSCKIYYEGNDDEEDEHEQEQEQEEDFEYGEYGFKRCPDCNENGLIRCPICCY